MPSDSRFLRHEPCPSCGSRDNLARYDDGHGYCFGCGRYESCAERDAAPVQQTSNGFSPLSGEFRDLPKRRIDRRTCERYDYRCSVVNGRLAQIADYRDASGDVIAQHLRFMNKDFAWVGEPRKATLWGRHLWPPQKMIVVTEGEIDCLTVSQLQGLRWPVVSLPNGAGSARSAIAANSDYLDRFETVVLMFDMDDAGRKAANDAASVLSPGKVRIASLPLKDPNEMLLAGRGKEVIDAIWQARPYRPDGIVSGADIWDLVSRQDDVAGIAYPFTALQKLCHGMRRSELVTLTAGTGIGKSLVAREIAYHLLMQGETVAYIALEESVKRTALGFLSCHMNRPLHIQRLESEDLREAFDATLGTGRIYLYDHWGSLESDNLLSKIRFLAAGLECKWIFLDHISIVVSGIEGGDERRIIDQTMTKLRSLVQELDVGMLVVSHLRRPDGKAHEEGAATSLSQLRGSAAVGQLSDIVIGLERDQQSEDESDITRVRVLKNRYTGETGIAGSLRYCRESGRLQDHTDIDFSGDPEEMPPF